MDGLMVFLLIYSSVVVTLLKCVNPFVILILFLHHHYKYKPICNIELVLVSSLKFSDLNSYFRFEDGRSLFGPIWAQFGPNNKFHITALNTSL